MFKLNFLGRGSSFNVLEGNTSAFIKDENKLILIDCGETVFKSLIENSLLNNIEEIDVILTHLHSDHVGSLSSLIHYSYYVLCAPINIIYPEPDKINQLLSLLGNEPNHYNIKSFNDKGIYTMRDYSIQYFLLPHDTNMNNYGYIIEKDNYSIFYSGDCSDLSEYLIEEILSDNIDAVYIEVSSKSYNGNPNLSFNKLCDIIPREHRNKTYCMHLDANDRDLIMMILSYGFNIVDLYK